MNSLNLENLTSLSENPLRKALKEISQPKLFGGCLIVKKDGGLAEANIFRSIWEKMKEFFNFGENRTNKRLIEFKIIQLLSSAKACIEPEEHEIIKNLAKRVGLTFSNGQVDIQTANAEGHAELATLVNAICEPNKESLSELESLADDFKNRYSGKITQFSQNILSLPEKITDIIQIQKNTLPNPPSSETKNLDAGQEGNSSDSTEQQLEPLSLKKVTHYKMPSKEESEEGITGNESPFVSTPLPVFVESIKENQPLNMTKKVLVGTTVLLTTMTVIYGIWTHLQPPTNTLPDVTPAIKPAIVLVPHIWSQIILPATSHLLAEVPGFKPLGMTPALGFTRAINLAPYTWSQIIPADTSHRLAGTPGFAPRGMTPVSHFNASVADDSSFMENSIGMAAIAAIVSLVALSTGMLIFAIKERPSKKNKYDFAANITFEDLENPEQCKTFFLQILTRKKESTFVANKFIKEEFDLLVDEAKTSICQDCKEILETPDQDPSLRMKTKNCSTQIVRHLNNLNKVVSWKNLNKDIPFRNTEKGYIKEAINYISQPKVKDLMPLSVNFYLNQIAKILDLDAENLTVDEKITLVRQELGKL